MVLIGAAGGSVVASSANVPICQFDSVATYVAMTWEFGYPTASGGLDRLKSRLAALLLYL